MRLLKYKFVDDHTLSFMLTEQAIALLKEDYPDVGSGKRVVRVGDEVVRFQFEFPSTDEMVLAGPNGKKIRLSRDK
jgi:hypothetical protein